MSNVELLRSESDDRFDPDPARSYTLRAKYYIDPAVAEREKEAVFYRSWNFVGHVEQLPEVGSYLACRVLDQDLFVIRGKDGELRAFYNVCKHRAHELVKGQGRTKAIVCPYHAWSYHLDGRLRTARGSEKTAEFDASEFCLSQVQVEVFCSFVFVNLDPGAPSLASQTPGLEAEIRSHCPAIDKLTFAYRLTYEIEANWKNVVDNYLECYHCTPAHPAFVDLVDIKNYRSVTHRIHSSHTTPGSRADSKAYSFDEATATQQGFGGWWLWPNLTFNTFPGRGNVTLMHIMPSGPESTLEHFDFYFPESTPNEEEMAAIRYIDEVLQVEDIGLVESVQRGLHSRGYDQGRFIVDKDRTEMSEHAVHHFHALVLEALNS
ncbi:MAG: ring-hydroxylating oxygenase subunit alpha [Rhodospirillales bacterium]|nr:ring-hydroxylating oxygenase subunit alpha [Rhodospirillales bacterium]